MERLKAAGVQSVIPLLPVNALFPYLGAETSQKYFPQLLLSDYQSGIEAALGLIPVPYEQALNGQEGVTTETLGMGSTTPRNRRAREATTPPWLLLRHLAQGAPQADQGGDERSTSRSRGPSRHGAPSIRLFAEAATKAGKDLNRRTFVTACRTSRISRAPSHRSGASVHDKMYGPTTYTVVKMHNNVPPSSQCILKTNHKPQGTCWVVVQKSKPLPSG